MTPLLDHGYMRLIETWGSDQAIVEAARQSTQKGFLGWPQDEKLLRYMLEHRHDSPFEFAGVVIEVQAPIFVFREWHRHRVWSYSEASARYAEMPELFYVPCMNRMMVGGQSISNKQSSGSSLSQSVALNAWKEIERSSRDAFQTYHNLLEAGVARELARLVLPVNTYSRMRAQVNLRNALAFLKLRLDESAQYEIRVYAQELEDILVKAFPRTMGLVS